MKTIVLGITGSIAAYKAAGLTNQLMKLGYDVHVVMTKSATSFVSPLTFQTLSKNPVITSLFSSDSQFEIEHISLAEKCNLLLIAPATANIISKIACGIADDFLSTFALTMGSQILIAPAMNTRMWHNPILQKNIYRLEQENIRFVTPEYGRLACGTEGDGRLASLERIIDAVEKDPMEEDVLKGRTVLITAGPTREMIDPVRYISNPSSGKMGYSLARAAKRMGARVILISGPTCLDTPSGVEIRRVISACQMRDNVMECIESADIFVSAAAVSDYMPVEMSNEKLKKGADKITLQMQQTPDILMEVASKRCNKIMVGFAAESQNILKNAVKKLREKNLDFIVANDITRNDIGFGSDQNEVTIIDKHGEQEKIPMLSKDKIAECIMNRIAEMMSFAVR
ncbi:bifunctional phosphopantothenoylcysteine decarboxylase/phosphopantothenate--cysteine ligase CoaBC [Candidatus Desantisbacteria bacterium]|nr:bifunctional phosphopantothenoylcysteine decarboxylase/phosphopantothenate--cysteine ligase CoaBC [Candidatus Desantisbacteria bacterium]